MFVFVIYKKRYLLIYLNDEGLLMIGKVTKVKYASVNERNYYRNKVYKSIIKSLIKKYLHNIKTVKDINDKKRLYTELSMIYSKLDKAVKRKVLHINHAARKKRILTRVLKQT